ncbi:hypothetical protein AAFF_G00368940 [Aldrovandia affinis]|uniref:Uncharacterized protein n=1 Tax=Aldrovandia affinis TaxID=143900 RepID=A0AAD7WMQ5_9TELE|nr:hypothetical protein AAFF_G00368940 [Aldrovandia affinis]
MYQASRKYFIKTCPSPTVIHLEEVSQNPLNVSHCLVFGIGFPPNPCSYRRGMMPASPRGSGAHLAGWDSRSAGARVPSEAPPPLITHFPACTAGQRRVTAIPGPGDSAEPCSRVVEHLGPLQRSGARVRAKE